MQASLHKHPYFKELKTLNLSPTDFAVMGGGCLFAHGVISEIDDLDVIVRGKAWNKASRLTAIQPTVSGIGRVLRFLDGKIEIFDTWYPGDWDLDNLIDTAEEIEGIKFVNLINLRKWLIIKNTPKTLMRVQMLDKYIRDNR